MENHCNYSDNWQPYIGDYDKFEYEVRHKDGTILDNCYPNAGMFQKFGTNEFIDEKDVVEIRFSQSPQTYLNYDYSAARMAIKEEPEEVIPEDKEECFYCGSNDIFKYGGKSEPICEGCADNGARYGIFGPHKPYVRETPKIGRNEKCPCESGKKYKNCCISFE